MPEHEDVFLNVKKGLVFTRTLGLFNNKRQTVLQFDPSQYGFGAAVFQELRPVAYTRRKLTVAEANYAQKEKELLVVLFGCENFDMYTFRRAICINGDHKPLQTK